MDDDIVNDGSRTSFEDDDDFYRCSQRSSRKRSLDPSHNILIVPPVIKPQSSIDLISKPSLSSMTQNSVCETVIINQHPDEPQTKKVKRGPGRPQKKEKKDNYESTRMREERQNKVEKARDKYIQDKGLKCDNCNKVFEKGDLIVHTDKKIPYHIPKRMASENEKEKVKVIYVTPNTITNFWCRAKFNHTTEQLIKEYESFLTKKCMLLCKYCHSNKKGKVDNGIDLKHLIYGDENNETE